MPVLPLWVAIVISVGSPLLSFVGVLLAARLSRRTASELEVRSRREETLRTVRWAAELAASDEPNLAQLGVAELVALAESDLLEDSQKIFIDAALESTIHNLTEIIDTIQAAGGEPRVIEDTTADPASKD